MQQQAHAAILRAAPAQDQHHFQITTDGSGTDADKRAIGSAWVLRSLALGVNQKPLHMRGASGGTHGSIQRAELNALLDGLTVLSHTLGLFTVSDLAKFCGRPVTRVEEFPPEARPLVWWVGDRETIILQMGRKPDGSTYYKRNTEPDLWYRMAWFESIFTITPVHVGRNTTADQTDVDGCAGAVRGLFKEIISQHDKCLNSESSH